MSPFLEASESVVDNVFAGLSEGITDVGVTFESISVDVIVVVVIGTTRIVLDDCLIPRHGT